MSSSLTPVAVSPFRIDTIHFAFARSQAIQLREHLTNRVVGATPEWSATSSNSDLVAYVRGCQPTVRVVFQGAPIANGTYRVGASGTLSPIAEQTVNLVFDPITGLSQTVTAQLVKPLPDRIGLHSCTWEWYVYDVVDPAIIYSVGVSTHHIGTTWQGIVADATQGLNSWVYRQLVEWTCEWCAGATDPKNICDAILMNLPRSGLRYGVNGHDVRTMLQNDGGMCGGWYQMFQQMAHCQGVFVHRRCFVVHWRSLPNGEVYWCGIVIRKGGLNQSQPTFPTREYNDNDTTFPIDAPLTLTTRSEPRYCFTGEPNNVPPALLGDGHCVNFLEYGGQVYLYDACFGIGPVRLAMPLPPDDYSILGGVALAEFKTRYLNDAVDYMLGTVYNGSVLFETIVGNRNGMTVKTVLIPEMVNGIDGLSFFWAG